MSTIITHFYPIESRYTTWYVCPGSNNFYFLSSGSLTPCSSLKNWTLLTVDVHVNIIGNWLSLIYGEVVSLLEFGITFLIENKKKGSP